MSEDFVFRVQALLLFENLDDRCAFWGLDYCLEWKTCSHNAIEKQVAFPMVVYDDRGRFFGTQSIK